MGLEGVASTPKELDRCIRGAMKRWEAMVRKAGITLE